MGGSYYGIPGAGGALQAATPGRPGIVTETVEIPNDAAGTIIGRGGETIKWLQQASGARIQVEPSSQATGGIRKVHVSGLHNVVTYARSLIMEQLAAKNVRLFPIFYIVFFDKKAKNVFFVCGFRIIAYLCAKF